LGHFFHNFFTIFSHFFTIFQLFLPLLKSRKDYITFQPVVFTNIAVYLFSLLAYHNPKAFLASNFRSSFQEGKKNKKKHIFFLSFYLFYFIFFQNKPNSNSPPLFNPLQWTSWGAISGLKLQFLTTYTKEFPQNIHYAPPNHTLFKFQFPKF